MKYVNQDGTVTAKADRPITKCQTPTHPFTPDVVEWARDMVRIYVAMPVTPMVALRLKASRQILAAVGEG